jgi:hypothetical protein
VQNSVTAEGSITIAGRTFVPQEIELVRELLGAYPALSRHELAATVCELLQWQRPNGKLKTRECRDLLEALADRDNRVSLPQKRPGRPAGSATRVASLDSADQPGTITGTLREIAPIVLTAVDSAAQRKQWRDLVGNYHYLGYATPYGAYMRYLACVDGHSTPIACLQYSSPAWRMRPRDQWIGWDDTTRAHNLQRIVNQSRFLILPWVQVKNLASHLLALSARRIVNDWCARFHVQPLLLETLVDTARYQGTSYRAANWIPLGTTAGRGRMDTGHQRHHKAPKSILVYPLRKDAREQLRR